MGLPSRDIYSAALALPEAQRLELASHLIASVDGVPSGSVPPGPPDRDWEDAWVEEVDRRGLSAEAEGEPWSRVRGRVQGRLGGR
jgi:hypothetical protein